MISMDKTWLSAVGSQAQAALFGRRRWWLVVLVFGGLAVSDLTYLRFTAGQTHSFVNVWDALLLVTGMARPLFYIRLPLFVFLVCEYGLTTGFVEQVTLRGGSRLTQWLAQCALVVMAALVYTLVAYAANLVVAMVGVRIDAGWSSLALSSPHQVGITADGLALPPWAVVVGQALLFFLGQAWFGTLTSLVVRVTQNAQLGLAAAVLVVILGYGAIAGWVPPGLARWFPGDAFQLLAPVEALPKVLYWLTGLAVFVCTGSAVVSRQDLFRHTNAHAFDRVQALVANAYPRLLRNLAGLWAPWTVFTAAAFFLSAGVWAGGALSAMPSTSSRSGLAVAYVFAGPRPLDLNFIALSLWLVPQLIFFFWVGQAAQRELSTSGAIVLPRFASRQSWWGIHVLTLVVVALVFTGSALVVTVLGVTLIAGISIDAVPMAPMMSGAQVDTSIGYFDLLGMIMSLWATSLLALGTVQTVVALATRQAVVGLLSVCILVVASAFIGTVIPDLARWLPGGQTLLLRHWPFDRRAIDFTLTWTLIYNLGVFMAATLAGAWWLRRADILASSHLE